MVIYEEIINYQLFKELSFTLHFGNSRLQRTMIELVNFQCIPNNDTLLNMLNFQLLSRSHAQIILQRLQAELEDLQGKLANMETQHNVCSRKCSLTPGSLKVSLLLVNECNFYLPLGDVFKNKELQTLVYKTQSYYKQ